MLKSLLTKAAMLAVTAAAVVWIGWPVPQRPEERAVSEHAEIEAAPAPRRPPEAVRRAALKLDLNRATVEELQTLPGIGAVLARRIAERRAAHGPFHSVEELQDVRGIGTKRLEQLRPLLTVAQAIRSPRAADPKPMTPPPGAGGPDGP